MRVCTAGRWRLFVIIACCLSLGWSMSVAQADPPVLEGVDLDKPVILPITVKAAYNDDTMFFNIEWYGDRGDTHDYFRFDGSGWVAEGVPRREAQSTIDNDPLRGPTNRTSANYESRVSFIINDPIGPNAVPGFSEVGCFCTCHDDSRAMPEWNPDDSHFTKYLNADTPGTLDMWHHRLARANPIGASDDFYVDQIDPADPTAGGRHGDAGTGPWKTLKIVDGNPEYMVDPATNGGEYSFDFNDLHTADARSFAISGTDQTYGPRQLPEGIPFDAAEYTPELNDTIPKRLLRNPQGSRGDITTHGTTFEDVGGEHVPEGVIISNTQRLLDTGNVDDTALADGGVYDIAFAVHTGMVTVRDHYVSFPFKIALGADGGDINAVRIEGSGRDTLPDFTDAAIFPGNDINLFLPGIASMEFLDGTLADEGAEYFTFDGEMIDQVHGGASAVHGGGGSCDNCHSVTEDDLSGWAGSMESLVFGRGGVTDQTPIPSSIPEPGVLTMIVGLLGLLGLTVTVRRRKKR